jgi:hypothetical protein
MAKTSTLSIQSYESFKMLIQDILRPEQIAQLQQFQTLGPPKLKHNLKRIKVQ